MPLPRVISTGTWNIRNLTQVPIANLDNMANIVDNSKYVHYYTSSGYYKTDPMPTRPPRKMISEDVKEALVSRLGKEKGEELYERYK